MSLTKLIQDSVSTAFDQLGDLKSTVVYTEEGEYDPTTGTVTGGAEHTTDNAIFTEYNAMEIDGTTVLITDRKLILFAVGLGFVPNPSGDVTVDGRVYQVVSVIQDTAGATYTLQVRS